MTVQEISPVDRLSAIEKGALERYQEEGGHDLSPVFQAELFELFLNGRSCEDIAKLKDGVTLGAIVQARLKYGWDQKLDDHVESLLMKTKSRVEQVQLESIHFLADMMSVTHKKEREAFEKYLQTGNEEDLGKLLPTSIKQYRDIIETLKTVSGSESGKNKNITGHFVVDHRGEVQGSTKSKAKAEEPSASDILKFLEEHKED